MKQGTPNGERTLTDGYAYMLKLFLEANAPALLNHLALTNPDLWGTVYDEIVGDISHFYQYFMWNCDDEHIQKFVATTPTKKLPEDLVSAPAYRIADIVNVIRKNPYSPKPSLLELQYGILKVLDDDGEPYKRYRPAKWFTAEFEVHNREGRAGHIRDGGIIRFVRLTVDNSRFGLGNYEIETPDLKANVYTVMPLEKGSTRWGIWAGAGTEGSPFWYAVREAHGVRQGEVVLGRGLGESGLRDLPNKLAHRSDNALVRATDFVCLH